MVVPDLKSGVKVETWLADPLEVLVTLQIDTELRMSII